MWAKNKQPGFTIVELLVVIIFIAILAAVTVVAYANVSVRARDDNIRSTANQIEKNIMLWYQDAGVLPAAGYGSTAAVSGDSCPGNTTSSGGFFQSGTYLCTMQDLLKARGYLTKNLTATLPKNTTLGSSGTVFMFYNCGASRYILMWSLESPTTDETNAFNTDLTTCSLPYSTYGTTYGMRASSIIKF